MGENGSSRKQMRRAQEVKAGKPGLKVRMSRKERDTERGIHMLLDAEA